MYCSCRPCSERSRLHRNTTAKSLTRGTRSGSRRAPSSALDAARGTRHRPGNGNGRLGHATRHPSAAYRPQGGTRFDPPCRRASRAIGLRRCVGQRTYHRAEGRAVSAVAEFLGPGADADLGRRLHPAREAGHQRAGVADAASAAAGEGTGDVAEPVAGPADPGRRRRLDGGGVQRARRAVQRTRPAHG